jgi:hypothetical protein
MPKWLMPPTNSHRSGFRAGFNEFLFFTISYANTLTHLLIQQYPERYDSIIYGRTKGSSFIILSILLACVLCCMGRRLCWFLWVYLHS